jgi:hypothetical protein
VRGFYKAKQFIILVLELKLQFDADDILYLINSKTLNLKNYIKSTYYIS